MRGHLIEMKRIVCVLLCLSLAFCAGCGAKSTVENAAQIVYSEKLLSIAGQDQAGWIEDLKSIGADNYEDIYESDGGTVTMEILDNQRDYWRELRLSLLAALQEDFAALDEDYRLEYDRDGTQLDFYYDLNLDASEAVYYVLSAEVFCACLQLLDGCDSDGWTVAINIYNAATGKLVQAGSSDTGLSYTEDDWKASE